MKRKLLTVLSFLLACAMLMSACGRNAVNEPEETLTLPSTQAETETFSNVSPEDIGDKTTESENVTVLTADSQKTVLNDGQTYTGLPSLSLKEFRVTDPDNTRGLSTEKHEYGFGVAKDGKPNQISVNNQAYFENGGFNALCLDTKTQEKVLYLTFDCGYENGYTAKILDTLKEKGVTAAFFCTLPELKSEPELAARMINEGHILGNHSVTHRSFPELSRTEMAKEIKEMDDYLRTNFGYSEPFFRFPMGEYSDCALELIGSLGYKCVFWSLAYSDWDVSNPKGGNYAFETVTARLHPGAVILLHAVSPDNAAALGDIIDYARQQGYVFKSLRDLP